MRHLAWRLFHFHSQALPEQRGGRCWWQLGRFEFHVEWSLIRFDFSLGLDLGTGDLHDGILLNANIPPLGHFYFGLEGFHRMPERELSISWHSGSIWLHLLSDRWEWKRGDRRVQVLHVWDWLLGNVRYSTRDLEQRAVVLGLPERDYSATARLFMSTWKRPRWFARRIMRIDIDIPDGLPIPGKGENSWDCEDDAIFGHTAPATSIRQGCENLVLGVLKTRLKRQGSVRWERLPA